VPESELAQAEQLVLELAQVGQLEPELQLVQAQVLVPAVPQEPEPQLGRQGLVLAQLG
jgi:hypothetical protein